MADPTERRARYRAADAPAGESKEAAALWTANDALDERIDALEARELQDKEIAALRELLEQDRRTRWVWATARTWALWVAAVGAGLTVGYDFLRTLIKRLAS